MGMQRRYFINCDRCDNLSAGSTGGEYPLDYPNGELGVYDDLRLHAISRGWFHIESLENDLWLCGTRCLTSWMPARLLPPAPAVKGKNPKRKGRQPDPAVAEKRAEIQTWLREYLGRPKASTYVMAAGKKRGYTASQLYAARAAVGATIVYKKIKGRPPKTTWRLG